MIKTANSKTSIVYCAKDVFSALNVPYKGISSIESAGASAIKTEFNTKVGKVTAKIKQYALSPTMVRRIASRHGKNAATVLGSNQTKQVEKLTDTISQMKGVLAQLLTKEAKPRKLLPVTGISATVNGQIRQQPAARNAIRELVQEYAGKRADSLGISGNGRSIFFDLTFKALYDAYASATTTKINLKTIADRETRNTGKKVSGLEIAERKGLTGELHKFAISFFKNRS